MAEKNELLTMALFGSPLMVGSSHISWSIFCVRHWPTLGFSMP